MLLKYIVSNYKSIGHSIEFSMLPTQDNTDGRFMRTINTKNGDWKVLRRGVLLGPNASGKSSFIESIEFVKNYIVNGQKSGRRTNINQFKGDFKELNNTSSFQFIFYLDEEVYDYGFSLDSNQVQEEWFMILTKEGFKPIFERETDEDKKTNIELNEHLEYFDKKDMQLAEVLKNSIQENQKNQLFLYKLFDNGNKKIERIIEWFSNIEVIFPNSEVLALELKIAQNEKLASFLSELLNNFDTGVNKIFSKKTKVEFKKLLVDMKISNRIIQEIYDKKSGMVNINGKLFIFNNDKDGEPILYELKLEHTLNGKIFDFDRFDESDGTKRLLDLLPMFFDIANKSKIYFIDELDRSLHTYLTKEILKNFVRDAANTGNQMIITAHDVNVIDLNYMSQGEIWFLEKTELGETIVKPFSNYKVENNYDSIKAYLAGRFGAVPQIKGEYK